MATTTNLSLNQPAYNSSAWDVPLNANETILDAAFGNTTSVALTNSNVTLTSSQMQAMRIVFTGSISANISVTIPAIGGRWTFYNNTSGSYTITLLSAGAGTSLVLQQGYNTTAYSDGTNIKLANDYVTPVANGGTGASTLTANYVLLGNGANAVQLIAPGASGNVLTSNGTTWASSAPTSGGLLIRAPQILTSGTSYTTPSNCTKIYVECVGGGGGGGAPGPAAGGGGGGGGYSAKYFTVTASTAYTYSIGAGGAQATSGGNTTFTVGATTITGGGGGGGANGSSANDGDGLSGNGGVGSGGDFNFTGSGGGTTSTGYQGGGYAHGAAGGSSFFGGGARSPNSGNGSTGGLYGGGGSGGGYGGSTGGAGAQGVIRITEYT